MDQSQALKEAMEDVTSVADQLRLLQQRIKGFGDASENLKEIGDALIQVSKAIKKIQTPYAELLEKAEGVLKKAEEATKELTAGKKAIEQIGLDLPNIFERIEALDISKTVDKSTKASKNVESELKKLKPILSGITDALGALSGSHAEMNAEFLDEIREVSASAKRASSDVSALHESTDKIAKSINSGKNAVIIFGLAATLAAVAMGYMLGDFHIIEAIFKSG